MHTVGCHTLGEDVGEQSAEAPCWVWRYLLSRWGAKGVSNGSNCQQPPFQLQCLCECDCGLLSNVRLKSTAVRLDICALWREGGDYGQAGELGRLSQC